MTTASEMHAILRAALLPNSKPAAGVLVEEVESPDGRRRADGIWAPFSRGVGLSGYEIKVSRSDVMAELADPMKCEPWMQYCERWWLFIADPALVLGLDVPERWGICAPPSGRLKRSLTIVQPAPKLKPMDTGAAWQRIATVEHYRREEKLRSAEWNIQNRDRTIRRLEDQLANADAAGDPRIAPLRRLISRIDGATRKLNIYNPATHDAVVACAVDLLAVQSWCSKQIFAARAVQRSIDEISREAKETSWKQELDARIAEIEKSPPLTEAAS